MEVVEVRRVNDVSAASGGSHDDRVDGGGTCDGGERLPRDLSELRVDELDPQATQNRFRSIGAPAPPFGEHELPTEFVVWAKVVRVTPKWMPFSRPKPMYRAGTSNLVARR